MESRIPDRREFHALGALNHRLDVPRLRTEAGAGVLARRRVDADPPAGLLTGARTDARRRDMRVRGDGAD
jgi:hypothetical protein